MLREAYLRQCWQHADECAEDGETHLEGLQRAFESEGFTSEQLQMFLREYPGSDYAVAAGAILARQRVRLADFLS